MFISFIKDWLNFVEHNTKDGILNPQYNALVNFISKNEPNLFNWTTGYLWFLAIQDQVYDNKQIIHYNLHFCFWARPFGELK